MVCPIRLQMQKYSTQALIVDTTPSQKIQYLNVCILYE